VAMYRSYLGANGFGLVYDEMFGAELRFRAGPRRRSELLRAISRTRLSDKMRPKP
jgi:hypothetical protein